MKKTREECTDIVRDRLEQKDWQHLGVDEQWPQMKDVMMETAENMWKIKRTMLTYRNMVVE